MKVEKEFSMYAEIMIYIIYKVIDRYIYIYIYIYIYSPSAITRLTLTCRSDENGITLPTSILNAELPIV